MFKTDRIIFTYTDHTVSCEINLDGIVHRVNMRRDEYDTIENYVGTTSFELERSHLVVCEERIPYFPHSNYTNAVASHAGNKQLYGKLLDKISSKRRIFVETSDHNVYTQPPQWGPPVLVILPMGDRDCIQRAYSRVIGMQAGTSERRDVTVNPRWYTPSGLWSGTEALYFFNEDPQSVCGS